MSHSPAHRHSKDRDLTKISFPAQPLPLGWQHEPFAHPRAAKAQGDPTHCSVPRHWGASTDPAPSHVAVPQLWFTKL